LISNDFPHKTLLLLPLPPPYAGPEVIASEIVHEFERMEVSNCIVINSTIRSINQEKGKFNVSGLIKFLRIYCKFISALVSTESLFLYICSSRVGFMRDSIYILTASVLSKSIVAQYHGGNFDGFYNSQPGWYKTYIRFVIRRISKLLVLGNSLKSMFDDLIPNERISVLGNGINPLEFPVKKTRDVGPFTILYIGHLTFPKGFYDLVKAYKLLSSEFGQEISFIFAGERVGCKPALSKFLSGNWVKYFLENLEDITNTIEEFTENAEHYHTKYLGIVGPDERLRALHQADLFVLPSYTEGLSMSCIEAMSTGLPVITTPVGAMSEIVMDKHGGFITDIGNHKMLASNIRKLYMDRERAFEMGQFNRKFIESNLTIQSVAVHLNQIIQQVL